MSNNDNDQIADGVKPGSVIELLKKPEPSSTNYSNRERTLSENVAKPDNSQEFKISLNAENKAKVDNSYFVEKKTGEKNPAIVEQKNKLETKTEFKPEIKRESWVNKVEKQQKASEPNSKPEQKNKVEQKQESFTARFGGEKKSFNEVNNKAKGKSLYEITPASTKLPTQQAPTIPPKAPKQTFVEKLNKVTPPSKPTAPKGPRK